MLHSALDLPRTKSFKVDQSAAFGKELSQEVCNLWNKVVMASDGICLCRMFKMRADQVRQSLTNQGHAVEGSGRRGSEFGCWQCHAIQARCSIKGETTQEKTAHS